MTDDRDGLVPCPFCGSTAYWSDVDELVACGNAACQAEGPFGGVSRDARAAWNTRPSATRIRELEAQLAEAREQKREALMQAIRAQGEAMEVAHLDASTKGFLAAIHERSPNGEYVVVQHAPDGEGWSVMDATLDQQLAEATDFYAGRYAERCGQLAVAREALTKARNKFAYYAELHAKKGTSEGLGKAAANQMFADELTESLAKLTGDHRAVREDGE